ncbi:hypothetical protein D7V64_17370 [Acinetobacter cumulans]|uniref:Uncharacterized protein n=1 Tax=Acinetobacter cumulans TaxID=2136182 RepID=A0A3A8FL09_9GAMM|nr:hypothetical protein [Acinetobacter cumulans]RKG46556.1 hypothetical protein D7V64_17370 [Acinetobacter cumulans]
MKLIRLATQETVSLEDGFLWSDEFDWKPKAQTQEYAIDGSLIVQEGTKLSGRPITLTAADGQGWVKRRDLRTLMAWSALGEQFTLQFEYLHDRRTLNVIFNHEAGAIEAKPVLEHPTVSEDDYYAVTLRFTELNNAD